MRTSIMLLAIALALPLASASSFLGTMTLEGEDNATLTLRINGSVTAPDTIQEEEEDPCPNLTITGLPQVSEEGEKLSFGFAPWEEGDEVTYWVEDIHAETLKDPYTTTSKSKKSYTPSIEGEERVIFFKASREREGCEESTGEAMVAVQGEPVVCETPEPIIINQSCEPEEDVVSLYVRAELWQEDITLYGNVKRSGAYLLFGNEGVREVELEEGPLSLTIHPATGANTYGLVLADGGMPMLANFSLRGEEETANETATNATLIIEPPSATGEVVLEDDTAKNMSVIAGLSGLAGAGLAITWIKTKLLRRRHDSA